MSFNQPPKKVSFLSTGSANHVKDFQYQPLVQQSIPAKTQPEEVQEPEIRLSENGFVQRLAEERALGVAETEVRLKRDFEQKLAFERARVNESIRAFEHTRAEYFAKVEGEVVQLALSIARKILHREAQVDPLLVTALVQIALTQIKEGSAVTVRVRPEEASRWRDQLREPAISTEVIVVEDGDRLPGDCVLETELGSVNVSFETQLKEVEQGFLDVLARKPQL